MRFSIRQLFAGTLLVALLILLIQTRFARKDIAWLEPHEERARSKLRKLEKRAASFRLESQVCKDVLESYEKPRDGDLTPGACFEIAKARFQRYDAQRADE